MSHSIEFLDPKQSATAALGREYEAFVNGHPNGNFFQSLEWSKCKPGWGCEAVVVRAGNGQICGSALALIRKLPLFGKTMLYAPRGPVCDYRDDEILDNVLAGLRQLARKHNACMLRIDPFVEESDHDVTAQFLKRGFLLKPNAADFATAQMRHHYILDIGGRGADELFNAFRTKWRYNIRLAQRKGVECKVCGKEAVPEFYELFKLTSQRHGFTIRSAEYLQRMMDAFGDNGRLYMCYYQGVPVCGALTIQYGRSTCYVYGASSNEYRNAMPNYLMQWEMIQWAVESHSTLYDFMGIPHWYDSTHPGYGVYYFKTGFNGRVASFAGEFDILYAPVTGRLLRWYLSKRMGRE